MDDMTKNFIKAAIAGQVRHVLSGAGAALAAHGAIQSSQTDAFVEIGSGIVMYAVGAGWSWWQKDGQALVAAHLAALKLRVQAIPPVSMQSSASTVSAAAVAISDAKTTAATPVAAAVRP